MKIGIRFKPLNRELHVQRGISLLKAAYKAGIKLEADCGGMGRCGKCKVAVSKGVTHLTPREREHLTPFEIENKYRLACQAFVTKTTSVTLPEPPRAATKILEYGIRQPVALQPLIKKYYLNLTRADLKHKRPLIDTVQSLLLQQGLKKTKIDFNCLRTLPKLLSRRPNGLTAIIGNGEVLGFEPGNTSDCFYGLALDIGTTTVVGYLFDLVSGRQLGVNSTLNQQVRYGSDVVSRIEHALNTSQGLKEVQGKIVDTVNDIIDKLCHANKITNNDIFNLTLVGNTTMSHLFFGLSPYFLARSPYNSLTSENLCVPPGELGIKIHDLGRVYSLPLISGFIGSDTVAVILSTRLHKGRVPRIAIDIGTNGEIVLTDGKKMVACAAAAGPAFEGAHIRCGMRGASGAIDRVDFKANIQYHVIDGIPPRGICGSGLVDTVAGMLSAGLVTDNGVLLKKDEIANPDYALRMNQETYNQFLITEHEISTAGQRVVITQKDIRQLQLAKGAIMAGIRILMKTLGLKDTDIRDVYLAGGFGNYIRPESALAINLLPNFKYARVTQVGNAAGSGAKMALLSAGSFNESLRIAKNVAHIDLARQADFNEEFSKGMMFKS